MSKEETVTVKIPKAIADSIRKSPWFKLYDSLDVFVAEAVRTRQEAWIKTGWKE